jgi:hypothetical protein
MHQKFVLRLEVPKRRRMSGQTAKVAMGRRARDLVLEAVF